MKTILEQTHGPGPVTAREAQQPPKRPYARTLFGKAFTPGVLRTHQAATAGVSGAIAGLTGAAFGGAIPAMLLYGATDLFGRVIPGIFKKKSVTAGTGDPRPGIFQPMTGGNIDALLARNPDAFTISYELGGGPVIDLLTGEEITPATNPNWQAEWYQRRDVPAPSPAPAPATPSPSPAPPPSEDKPVGMISTGLGLIGNIAGDVIGGLSSLTDQFLPLAAATAPLWGGAAPTAAAVITGGAMMPATQEPAPFAGIPGGASPVSYPTALPGGAMVPTMGKFDVPMIPPGNGGNGYATRLPSTFEIPYQTASGATRHAHYKNMGRPLLYSGDLAACKRVKKVASKARRRSGGR